MLHSLEITRELIKCGHNPFNPLLWHYIHLGWRHSPDEDKYYELVSAWIVNCDAVFVGSIPNWENSGVHREIKMAIAMGKPIFYRLEDIPNNI